MILKTKYIIMLVVNLIILCSNIHSQENSNSDDEDYMKDQQLTFVSTADVINNNGLNITLGLMNNIEIYHNKVIPISVFTEINYSIPIIKDSSESFSCLNAGLRFSRRITGTWYFGISIGSGIALFDEQFSVNSNAAAFLTYKSVSIMCNIRGIVSDKLNASSSGIGISYSF